MSRRPPDAVTEDGKEVLGGKTRETPTRGWQQLDWGPFWREPQSAAVLTDFDGTLAPIVEDRYQAVPLPGAPPAIAALARRFGVVGVVSGRPVEFLASVLPGMPSVVLVGLYGLQHLADGRLRVNQQAAPWQRVVARAVTEAQREAPPGLEVEDKGLSMALHWRRVPSAGAWATEWAQATVASSGLVAQPGRLSVELVPPVQMDKGLVVDELAGRARAACFLGDDTGDLPAFAALRRMRMAGKCTAAVGVKSSEQPDELAEAADILVDGPAGALELLVGLAGLGLAGSS